MGHALLICNKCMRIKLEIKLTNSIIGISPQIYSKYHNNTLNISHHDSYKEKIGYCDHRILNRDNFLSNNGTKYVLHQFHSNWWKYIHAGA